MGRNEAYAEGFGVGYELGMKDGQVAAIRQFFSEHQKAIDHGKDMQSWHNAVKAMWEEHYVHEDRAA